MNAWNEWAEGCHLEPDLTWGRQFLEATKAALNAVNGGTAAESLSMQGQNGDFPKSRRLYWGALAFIAEQRELLNNLLRRHR